MPRFLAPRYWPGHLVALAAVVAAGLLGWWQLDAWQERRAAEALDLTNAEPVALAEVMGPDDAFPGTRVGQPVDLTGVWVPAGTVYVSGRELGGRDGYWMVIPLAIGASDAIDSGEAPAIPVVLGWVAAPDQAPAPPDGSASLVGLLQPSEGTGAVDDDPTDDVLPQLRTADVIQHVDQDLYGAYAVARDGELGLPPGALEQLPEPEPFTALRNLLYAIEWWFFGAFALFIWWRWVRETQAEIEPKTEPVASAP